MHAANYRIRILIQGKVELFDPSGFGGGELIVG
jgi:hypothetical protein